MGSVPGSKSKRGNFMSPLSPWPDVKSQFFLQSTSSVYYVQKNRYFKDGVAYGMRKAFLFQN
jgi:hypothetical protein